MSAWCGYRATRRRLLNALHKHSLDKCIGSSSHYRISQSRLIWHLRDAGEGIPMRRCTCGATFGLRDHYCTEVGATRTLRSTCVIVISTVKPAGSSVDHSYICLIISYNFVICHNNIHCTGRMFVEMLPREHHFCPYYKRFIWDV